VHGQATDTGRRECDSPWLGWCAGASLLYAGKPKGRSPLAIRELEREGPSAKSWVKAWAALGAGITLPVPTVSSSAYGAQPAV